MKNAELFFKDWDTYCLFKNPATGYSLYTEQEYARYLDYLEQEEAEQYAENAWLRHAESPTNDDLAFERYEEERGVIPFDVALKNSLSGKVYCDKADLRTVSQP